MEQRLVEPALDSQFERLPADERFRTQISWLDSRHSFSFGEHYDPERLGFRALRVINDDLVAPAAGFPTHSHRDMEIITYVVDGALAHADSMGNGSTIRRGEVQRMSAGTLVTHSEMNPDRESPVRFLQLWILPAQRGLAPSYEQATFDDDDKRNRLRLVASSDGREGSVQVHQDIALYASCLDAGRRLEHSLSRDRYGWLQVVSGQITVHGHRLDTGDGLAMTRVSVLNIEAQTPAEFLLFDLG
jgi:redox-sensitive bicupin YhaK (pirin superfamily)